VILSAYHVRLSISAVINAVEVGVTG